MSTPTPNLQFQQAPDRYREIMAAWFHWRSVWNGVHYTLGSASAFLATIIAANAGAVAAASPATNAGGVVPGAEGFMPPIVACFVAAAAAVLTFLLTITKPAEKAKGFEAAARHMEGEIALYESGGNVNLGKAYNEGLGLLS